MKPFIILATLLAVAAAAAERPNIVVIYADDLGWRDVGYQSDGDVQTPVLDKMAQDGMVFTDAYTNAANCQPARACLLTGNYTPRHHVFAVRSTNRGPENEMRLIPIPNRDGLADEDVTMAEALKASGYVTGHFGKWHLYREDGDFGEGTLPSTQGFDVTYDSFGEGELPEGARGNKKGPESDPKGVFDLSKQACDFIEKHQDKPFFVYLAHHAPHGPVQSRASTREKIPDTYKACVYDMDASIDLVLSKLRELKLEKKTLVIFTSDNGGSARSQAPLRGKKGTYYEGGIREPMIALWPGVINAGSTCTTPVSQIDYFPTFLELAGAKTDTELDGESLVPLLKQTGDLSRKSIFWHMPGYLDSPAKDGRDNIFRTRPTSVIRKGRWKLHLYLEEWVLDGGIENIDANNAIELFDLTNDRGEQNNLANENPEMRNALIEELISWHGVIEAPIPNEQNPKYAPGKEGDDKKKDKKKKDKKKNRTKAKDKKNVTEK